MFIDDSVTSFIIKMRVAPAKRKELLQTLYFLLRSIRTENGCGRYDFYRNTDIENELCILGAWQTHENLMCHLKSDSFKVLKGAMTLLTDPYDMTFHEISHHQAGAYIKKPYILEEIDVNALDELTR